MYYIDLSRSYQQLNIDGYRIDVYRADNGSIEYCDYFIPIMRRASIRLATWAKHLHGNAPGGTIYGSYRITLPNKKRITVKAYLSRR